jgi:hypothetical protein
MTLTVAHVLDVVRPARTSEAVKDQVIAQQEADIRALTRMVTVLRHALDEHGIDPFATVATEVKA